MGPETHPKIEKEDSLLALMDETLAMQLAELDAAPDCEALADEKEQFARDYEWFREEVKSGRLRDHSLSELFRKARE
jgi:hypothetical protein